MCGVKFLFKILGKRKKIKIYTESGTKHWTLESNCLTSDVSSDVTAYVTTCLTV